MSYRFSDRLMVDSEVSDGDLGAAGRIGSNYLVSDATSLYLNYALENERTDNGLRNQRGNLVAGARTRLSDSASVFHEERYERAAERFEALAAEFRWSPTAWYDARVRAADLRSRADG